jgi:2-polyprenyl-3-methyl-5-hydroxy-6-metoxy-1,4-benzoquinol methylase
MKAKHHVCPWWVGYLLASPLRRLFEDPERILGPLIRPGMRVLDFGAAMGFYSLPAARLAGERGHVTCVDLQPKMLAALRGRAARSGLTARIDTVVIPEEGLGKPDGARPYDLILLIHVLHEVPDAGATLRELAGALAPGGRLLLIEPRGHVARTKFEAELELARAAGLTVREEVRVRRGFGAVLG